MQEAFREAVSRDRQRTRTWVAVVDGNETQLRLLAELAAHHGVQLTIVLDLFHVLGYLWKAGHAVAVEGSNELEQWATVYPPHQRFFKEAGEPPKCPRGWHSVSLRDTVELTCRSSTVGYEHCTRAATGHGYPRTWCPGCGGSCYGLKERPGLATWRFPATTCTR